MFTNFTTLLNNDYTNDSAETTGSFQGTLGAMFDNGILRHNAGWTVAFVMAYTMVFVPGVVANSSVIVVVIFNPKIRSVKNLLVANLAIADLLVVVCCIPATLISNILQRKL